MPNNENTYLLELTAGENITQGACKSLSLRDINSGNYKNEQLIIGLDGDFYEKALYMSLCKKNKVKKLFLGVKDIEKLLHLLNTGEITVPVSKDFKFEQHPEIFRLDFADSIFSRARLLIIVLLPSIIGAVYGAIYCSSQVVDPKNDSDMDRNASYLTGVALLSSLASILGFIFIPALIFLLYGKDGSTPISTRIHGLFNPKSVLSDFPEKFISLDP